MKLNPWGLFTMGILCGLLFLTSCASDDDLPTATGDTGQTNVQPNDPDPNNNNGGGNNNGGNGNNNGGNNNGGQANGQLSALPLNVPQRADNPASQAKINLGRLLFWDPILSGEQDVSCATCHHPNNGYADAIDLSIGVGGQGLGRQRRVGSGGFALRNSPTILNTAYNGISENGNVNPAAAPMFWDNRTRSLEEQATGPLHSFVEMRGSAYSEEQTIPVIVSRLNGLATYRNMFNQAFGANSISGDNIAKAIAAFERTLVANNSPFDRYMRGDNAALSQQQINGMQAFTRVGCVDCHSGPMLSDYRLHVLGVRENNKLPTADNGAGDFAFRTPTLRNLSFTAPYMHNGTFNSLRQVLNFYDDDNNNSRNPNVQNNRLDPDLRNLGNLNNNDINAILSFLESLNDGDFDRTVPNSVPSGLNPGGDI